MNANALVVECMEANAFYHAMSDKNRHLASEAWMGGDEWMGKSVVSAVIAEAFLMRAETLTK